MKMKKILKVLGGVALSYGVLSYYVMKNIENPKVSTREKGLADGLERGHFKKEEIEGIKKEVFEIPSTMGYQLYGWWIPNGDSKKTVVLCHGITSEIYGSMKYFKLYYDRGFNVLTYDHRNHGESGKADTTLGFKEKEDLETVVDWVRQKVGEDSIIGTHGESMGGATVLQHISEHDDLAFVVADCPFGNGFTVLKHIIKQEHKLPLWIGLFGASVMSKIKGNGFLTERSAVKTIEEVETPIMFVHGDEDDYVPTEHSIHLYEHKKTGIKKLVLIEGAVHANAIVVGPEKYNQSLEEFLEEIGIE